MGKGFHKVFKTVIKEISQDLPPLEEYGSEVSHFIPEPRNFFWSYKIVIRQKDTLAKGNSEGY